MSRFVILFEGGEGSSPLVRLLDNFPAVSIVRETGRDAWEPFGRNACGPMELPDLERCLDGIFAEPAAPVEDVNAIYTRTAPTPLEFDAGAPVIGFKMRLEAPQQWPAHTEWLRRPGRLSQALFDWQHWRYKRRMIALLARRKVTVFVLVRGDALRWSLSMYHGDGTGKKGNVQFKVARGEIRRDELAPFNVDLARLGRLLGDCEKLYERKRQLLARLEDAGVRAFPLHYEDFLRDRPGYFRRFFDLLGAPVEPAAIQAALGRGAYFEKVHAENIAEFVINHEEVLARYGDRTACW